MQPFAAWPALACLASFPAEDAAESRRPEEGVRAIGADCGKAVTDRLFATNRNALGWANAHPHFYDGTNSSLETRDMKCLMRLLINYKMATRP